MPRETVVLLSPVAPTFDPHVYQHLNIMFIAMGYQPFTVDTLKPLEDGARDQRIVVERLSEDIRALRPAVVCGYAYGGTMAREVAATLPTDVPVVTVSAPLTLSRRLQGQLLQVTHIARQEGVAAAVNALNDLVEAEGETGSGRHPVTARAFSEQAGDRFITGLTFAAHYVPSSQALSLVPHTLNIVGEQSRLVQREDVGGGGASTIEVPDAPMRLYVNHVNQLRPMVESYISSFRGRA